MLPIIVPRTLFPVLLACSCPLAYAVDNVPPSAVSSAIPAWVAEIEAATPTKAKPLPVGKDDKELRDKWRKWVHDYNQLPVSQVRANPTAEQFPGEVKEGTKPVRDFRFAVDMNVPRWQSTGLYAAPGEKIVITIPESAKAKGLSVRIGCHTDNISKRDKWERFPVISREFPLKETRTEIANAFGGLIYIEVPRDEKRGGISMPTYGGYVWINENVKSATPASFELNIDGGISSPLYQLGKTTAEEWKKQLEATGAPWGEIAGKHYIMSLPIDMLRSVNDPKELTLYWDKVLDECWKFGGWPSRRSVPERFVPDIQISAGYLHSGYPFMGHYHHGKEVVDLATLKTKGNWGFFHELGHNHQGQAYTFSGEFVEVIVNLHTIYLMKTMCGLDPETGRGGKKAWDVAKSLQAAEQGKRGAFELLSVYVPLIDAFGYDSLTRTFQTYWSEEGLKGLDGSSIKMDAFVKRYSLTVKRDCSGYFSKYGITCTDETRKELSSLKSWTPPVAEAKGEASNTPQEPSRAGS